LGSIKEISKGKFGITAEAGKHPATGKRHRKYCTYHGNITGARKELARIETELAQGIFLEPTGITVAKYLRWWLEQHSAAKQLSPKTCESYKDIIERYLIRNLGALKLEELTTAHIQAFVTEANKGLSSRTVEYAVTILKTALKHAAKKHKFIRENPAEMVDMPTHRRHQFRVLTGEEMHRLLTAAADMTEYPVFAMAFYTGMRRGEILGLRWQDVNLDKGTAAVNQTLQPILGQGLVIKDCPKTEAGFRIIDLTAGVVSMLRQVEQKQAEYKLALGTDYKDRGLVFCLYDGRPLDPHNLSRRFHALVKQQGLEGFRFHDTRHTHASLLLADGEQIHVVQQRLGHRDATTTMNLYGHAIPGQQRAAADKFGSKYSMPEFGKKGVH
jgi:integrase